MNNIVGDVNLFIILHVVPLAGAFVVKNYNNKLIRKMASSMLNIFASIDLMAEVLYGTSKSNLS